MFIWHSALLINLLILNDMLAWLAQGHLLISWKVWSFCDNYNDQLPGCQKNDFALASCFKQHDLTASPRWWWGVSLHIWVMVSDACCVSKYQRNRQKQALGVVSVFVALCSHATGQTVCCFSKPASLWYTCIKHCVLNRSQIHSQHEIVNMHVVI